MRSGQEQWRGRVLRLRHLVGGVTIERFDGVPLDERGIVREGGPYIAWFRDPSGNILSVLQDR